ncbi:type I-E CRISPR-associated protein Cas7/Cse4/CasC [Pannonibacter phragmitetus]|uniref:type I-E CRISPR-associated protein Cas7/Cse4/CasC n=1 Tax=Pannonibacter phragmitetus TaxID=121719 RepID=UPI000B963005|nr:type I-E CRISPR-associated protein Cas7/Cse4/CasC [Pannonibacter phragmitetus]
MARFLQLHILTPYPASNPNRDDLGRPKSMILGGVPRMRMSSQAIKRSIRTHEAFTQPLTGNLGERTQRMGQVLKQALLDKGADEDKAVEIAREVAGVFGKLKGEKDANPTYTEQLAFISPQERQIATDIALRKLAGEKLPKEKELAKTVFLKADGAVDIAMFGRMLADNPDFNRDAAVQVAHAFTTSRAEVEDDFYTAVDDLKRPSEDAGAGFVGEAGFGAGIFYLYICADLELLAENLGGDRELAARAVEALVRTVCVASPSGKKNSFANHVKAEFMLAELGDAQPRTLAGAFTRPVEGRDHTAESARALLAKREAFAKAYGRDWASECCLQVGDADSATLDELAAFAAGGVTEGAEAGAA